MFMWEIDKKSYNYTIESVVDQLSSRVSIYIISART